MEHREPPRIYSAEGRNREPVAETPEPPPRRFPRLLPPPNVRRLSPQGIALAALGVVATVALAVWVVGLLMSGGMAYVHGQAENRLSFDGITLKDDPPSWFKGGRKTFLERVRAESRFERAFSVPELDLKALRLAFFHDAWVKDVGQVRKAPNEVVVPLRYRTPVAIARFEQKEAWAVDADGVLLPRDGIAPETLARLVFLQDFAPPANPREGVKWTRLDPQDVPQPDGRVAEAAKLAAYFQEKIKREAVTSQELPRFYVFGDGSRVGWVQVGPNHFFRWKNVLDDDRSTSPTDDEKWALLSDHVRHCPENARHDFQFSRKGLEPLK